jgi:tetratricopeptide (TPR) repeat protein
MAKSKVKKNKKAEKQEDKKIPKAPAIFTSEAFSRIQPAKSWLENRMATARKVSEHRAAKAIARFGAPAGVALLAFLVIYSLFLSKNPFQLAKEQLLKNPNDFEAHLILAEEYLSNNQVEEAERELLLAQGIEFGIRDQELEIRVLGEESSSRWEELWQRKIEAKPEDIRQLIAYWEEIISEKPNYRDGYLQLAILNYKLFENEKAKEYLERALELDPNFETTKELKKVLGS